jgi:heat shock protein HslJ
MIRTILLLTLTMTACQADETISGYADPDAVWALTDLNGQSPQSEITLTFPEKGKIAGRAPCNRYFGTQTKPLPWFETGPLASTKMACPNLAEESQYFQTLEKSTLAEVSETTLILSDNTGPLLTYKRQ